MVHVSAITIKLPDKNTSIFKGFAGTPKIANTKLKFCYCNREDSKMMIGSKNNISSILWFHVK